MTYSPKEYQIIDPCSNENSDLLSPLFSKSNYLSPYSVFSLDNPSKEYSLTDFIFKLKKPERKSKKTGLLKPESIYFAVCNPDELGSGDFGHVYPIKGVWKLTPPNKWTFKEKPQKYLIKTNLSIDGTASESVINEYNKEQKIGKYVPHMEYKYPPTHFDDRKPNSPVSFLRMKLQKGNSLGAILLKLKDDPNYLTVTQKLQLTVNLLKALPEQVHSVPITDIHTVPAPVMIHRDLKPDNTIVDSDMSVKFIDYGFACLTSEPKLDHCGTPLYMEPRIYLNDTELADENSDLYSISRIITEIWGDTSRLTLESRQALIKYNKTNVLKNLFNGMEGLSENDKQSIETLLIAATSAKATERPSRQKMLEVFELLLQEHLTSDDVENAATVRMESLDSVAPAKIAAALRSNHSDIIINRAKTELQLLKYFSEQLLHFDIDILTKFQACGLSFSHMQLSLSQIQEYQLSPETIQQLIHLGVQFENDILTNWFYLEIGETKNERVRWAKILRVLHQATDNPEQKLGVVEEQHLFRNIYYWHFFKNNTALDDERNVRLVTQHLTVIADQQQIKQEIILAINKEGLADTPLGTAILNAHMLTTPPQQLLLAVQLSYEDLQREVQSLIKIIKHHKSLNSCSFLPHRNTSIASIQALLNNRLQLVNMDWQTALMDHSSLHDQGGLMDSLDGLVGKLLDNYAPETFSELYKELDRYYLYPNLENIDLTNSVSLLTEASNYLNNILTEKIALREMDRGMADDTLIESGFSVLLDSVSVHNAAYFKGRCKQYNNFYTRLHSLFVTLKAGQNATLPSQVALYQYLDNAFWERLPTLHLAAAESMVDLLERFACAEEVFRINLNNQSQAQEFVYAIFLHMLSSKPLEVVNNLTNLIYSIGEYTLLDQHILARINAFLTLQTTPAFQTALPQFQTVLWNHLNGSFETVAEHKKNTLYALDKIIRDTRPRSPLSPLTQLSVLSPNKKRRMDNDLASDPDTLTNQL